MSSTHNPEFWNKGNRRCSTIISVIIVVGLLAGGTILLFYGVLNMEKINQYKFHGKCMLNADWYNHTTKKYYYQWRIVDHVYCKYAMRINDTFIEEKNSEYDDDTYMKLIKGEQDSCYSDEDCSNLLSSEQKESYVDEHHARFVTYIVISSILFCCFLIGGACIGDKYNSWKKKDAIIAANNAL